jgi:hypothetical protein
MFFLRSKLSLSSPDLLHARYFRVTFSPPFHESKDNPDVGPRPPDGPVFGPPNIAHIASHGVVQKYPELKCCLYCSAMEYKPGSGRRLSDEHIVPEGLGGTLILPEASCADCAKITGNIEGSILRTLLWAPRRQLGVRSKKRKRAANRGFPITTVVGGKDVVFELPIEDHPSILLLLGLKTPRMLSFRAVGEPDVAGIWTHTFGSPTALYKRGAERMPRQDSILSAFVRCLQK